MKCYKGIKDHAKTFNNIVIVILTESLGCKTVYYISHSNTHPHTSCSLFAGLPSD